MFTVHNPSPCAADRETGYDIVCIRRSVETVKCMVGMNILVYGAWEAKLVNAFKGAVVDTGSNGHRLCFVAHSGHPNRSVV